MSSCMLYINIWCHVYTNISHFTIMPFYGMTSFRYFTRFLLPHISFLLSLCYQTIKDVFPFQVCAWNKLMKTFVCAVLMRVWTWELGSKCESRVVLELTLCGLGLGLIQLGLDSGSLPSNLWFRFRLEDLRTSTPLQVPSPDSFQHWFYLTDFFLL